MTHPPSTVPHARSTFLSGGRPSAATSIAVPTTGLGVWALSYVSVRRFGAGVEGLAAASEDGALPVDSGVGGGVPRPHPEDVSAARIAAPRTVAARMEIVSLVGRGGTVNDGQLRSFDIERLELAGATVLVLGGHGEATDPGWRVVGDDPLRDPEGPFRLLLVRAPPHRNVLRLAGVVQMHDELCIGVGMRSGLGIDGFDAPADRLATLIHVAQRAVLRLAWPEEVRHVAAQNEFARLLGRRLRRKMQRGNREPRDNDSR